MDEENKIKDGEVKEFSEESFSENTTTVRKKRRSDFYIEMVLFFILGVLIGITLKTEASKRITIGYNDYQMNIHLQDYDINKLQTDLTRKNAEETSSEDDQTTTDQNQNGETDASSEEKSQNQ